MMFPNYENGAKTRTNPTHFRTPNDEGQTPIKRPPWGGEKGPGRASWEGPPCHLMGVCVPPVSPLWARGKGQCTAQAPERGRVSVRRPRAVLGDSRRLGISEGCLFVGYEIPVRYLGYQLPLRPAEGPSLYFFRLVLPGVTAFSSCGRAWSPPFGVGKLRLVARRRIMLEYRTLFDTGERKTG